MNRTGLRTPSLAARAVDRAIARLLRLPNARYDYRIERDIPMTTRDGAVLLADHYAPVTQGPRGTILVRTPYGRGFPGDLVEARAYVGRGYHVVLQSCRGTFGSSGTFDPMAQEVDDAQDAVAWLRTQPWFDGRLATVGGSYLGWTQWALLQDPPPELRTSVIAVAPHDWSKAVYGTGAFLLNDLLMWAQGIAHQERYPGLRGVFRLLTIKRRLTPVFGALPLADAAEQATSHRTPWFRTWLSSPDFNDPGWERFKLDASLRRVSVPVRLIAGWQDLFLGQTMHQYEVLRDRGVDVSLTVGPWTHQELGVQGLGRYIRGNLEWLAVHLAGEPGIRPRHKRPVQVFVTGLGEWRDMEQWPPSAGETVRYLHRGGHLSADEPSTVGALSSTLVFDPADPTPTVGGPVLTPDAGVKKNAVLEGRSDLLVFHNDRGLEIRTSTAGLSGRRVRPCAVTGPPDRSTELRRGRRFACPDGWGSPAKQPPLCREIPLLFMPEWSVHGRPWPVGPGRPRRREDIPMIRTSKQTREPVPPLPLPVTRRADVPLFACNEPITLSGSRAQRVLQRRINQSIAEYEVLNTLEQSWGGLCTHVREGYNIGKPPYGYKAKIVPHPNPAKADKGHTKSLLVADGARAETVTQIAHWRYYEGLGYDTIRRPPQHRPDQVPPARTARWDACPQSVGQDERL